MFVFTEDQVERYARNILLPGVGGAGQERLARSRVLVIGAGGLGSPAAYYLAAAGVGTIGIVDDDAVEISNLQRQILHATRDIGRPKAVSAGEKLKSLNPDCDVVTHHLRLTADNIAGITAAYQVIVDGTDNFPSRRLINEVCVRQGKPLVHGGVLQFVGQALTILPGRGPCLACIFPEPPGSLPTCAQAGILGAVAGVIGAIQANEALKLLLGLGELLVGRLLSFDALRMRFAEVAVSRDPDCPVCGKPG
ncbi:MAG: HesA/MoeB/ThiF family protein [Peptococcaceae bacterium]|nr:HesA/MoeB/ThiF family protein [Peptococcaceae bacterium]